MLRFALPRYRPCYIAVTYLVADPTPARASDPLFAAAWLALLSAVTYLVADPTPSPGQRPRFLPQLGLR